MEMDDSLHLLQAMIDYFEAGNPEADAAAKAIIESDFEYSDHWQAEMEELLRGVQWSGLRGPEAELVASALRLIQQRIAERPR